MVARTILLVEDNKDDEELTLRALARNNIGNHVVVVYWLILNEPPPSRPS